MYLYLSVFHLPCVLLFIIPGNNHNNYWAFSIGKESICQCRRDAKDAGSISGLGRNPREENGNPLQ